jgi:2-polyprenyl-6-methoxyphenol hydroxylase-like FAD-dependent oxidoreductase
MAVSNKMNVLISGAGIAGPTLAYWLLHYGMQPTIVEHAPQLRRGGYVIDFWGAGYEIAGRMGLLPEIGRRGYRMQEVKVVDRDGNRVSGFPASVFENATGGRYISLPRGELADVIFGSIEGKVEAIFGDSIASIAQDAGRVQVSFEHRHHREFDLVVGADGLHSRVRELAFGTESRYERYLGYKVAAFETGGYRPREELVYVMHTEVGQQLSRFSMRDDRTMFLLIFADENPQIPSSLEAQKQLLHARFENSGWESRDVLGALARADELYFDRVSQIRMEPAPALWTRGRVALLGDAAFCVSLLAGQGSALAMIAAYILAGELHRAEGDHSAAFARYEQRFGTFVRKKQDAALDFAGSFAPKSKVSLFVRNQVMKLMRFPWVANLVFARGLTDKISLPDY